MVPVGGGFMDTASENKLGHVQPAAPRPSKSGVPFMRDDRSERRTPPERVPPVLPAPAVAALTIT